MISKTSNKKDNKTKMIKSVKRSHRAIIVLGMHRSGTSALARTLNLCGVNLGSNLMPPGPKDNVKGFWEHMDIYQTNEKLLHNLGSSWDDVRALPDRWWNSDFAEAYKLEIISILKRDFSSSLLWGVKDPRICRFLPVWRPLLEQTGSKPYFLIIVRNPLEVVSSLAKRDGFSKGKSCLLWLKHLIESENGTRNTSRMFVTYEELLSDWKGLLTRVEKTFGFKLTVKSKKASSEIKAFLQDSMRHNRVTDTTLTKDKTLSKWVRDMYLAISGIVDGDDTRLIKAVNTIEAKLKEAVSLYDPALTDIWEKYQANSAMLQERSRQLDDINNRLEEFRQDKGYQLSSIDHMQSGIKERDERIQQFDSDLTGLRSELSAVQQTAVRREVEVDHLQVTIKEKDDHIQQVGTKLAGLREEFAASQETVKEQESKVAQLQADIKERDEHIKRLESDSAGLQEQCTTLQSAITEHNAEVSHLQGSIKEKDERIQQIDSELTGIREEFAASQQAVKEHESKVNHLQADIKERDEHVQRLESDSADLQKQYTALQGTITESDTVVAHLQGRIKEKDDHIQQVGTELAVLREEFTASQQAVMERESKVDQLQVDIKERDEYVQRLENDSEVMQEQYTALQGAITERDEELADLQLGIKEKDNHIQKIDAEIAGLREEFAASQQSVKEHESKVAQLQAEIKERDEHVQRLDSDVAVLRQEFSTLEGVITERDAEVTHLQGNIKEKDDRIHQLDADLGKLRDEVDSLQTHVVNFKLDREAILNSTSWKLTLPFRMISQSLKNLHRRSIMPPVKIVYWLFPFRIVQKIRKWRTRKRIIESGLFDEHYYLKHNPDVNQAGMDPLWHYIDHGETEGRSLIHYSIPFII